MGKVRQELHFQGIPISEGVGFGPLTLVQKIEEIEEKRSITEAQVDGEVSRYRCALEESRRDLDHLESFLMREASEEAVSIIATHKEMLSDPFLTTEIEQKIEEMLLNTESVFRQVIAEYERQFLEVNDPFFQQRMGDVRDISRRVLKNLSRSSPQDLSPTTTKSRRKRDDEISIAKGGILLMRELAPSDTADAIKAESKGIISQMGGRTSHAALIARSKGIPYVVGIDVASMRGLDGAPSIIDGHRGRVILFPKRSTVEKYREQEALYSDSSSQIDIALQQATTKDGEKIQVFANVEHLEDLPLFKRVNGSGIGLCRSEFLFNSFDLEICSEERQVEVYREVLLAARGRSTTIRLFDLGADKDFVRGIESEINPALGCRSIRFLHKHPHILYTQLRALLRASISGNLRILIPLITSVEEVREIKKLVEHLRKQLSNEGYKVKEDIPVGAMIEVPGSAVIADFMAKESDFLSIGTNDLTQYAVAADRENTEISEVYRPLHPSVLRMLKMVVEGAKGAKCPVSICGEMASKALLVPVLIGLGLQELSCAPRYIPKVKKWIERISLSDAKSLVDELMELETVEKIKERLSQFTL